MAGNKSGRPWKEQRKRVLHSVGTPFEIKQKRRQEGKIIKDYERELKLEKEQQKKDKKQRAKMQRERQEENKQKAEVVQGVSSRKVKRMTRRHIIKSRIRIAPDPNAQIKVY